MVKPPGFFPNFFAKKNSKNVSKNKALANSARTPNISFRGVSIGGLGLSPKKIPYTRPNLDYESPTSELGGLNWGGHCNQHGSPPDTELGLRH